MLLGSSNALNYDFQTIVTKTSWRLSKLSLKRFSKINFFGILEAFCALSYQSDPHIFVKLDIFRTKSVNELLVVRWTPSKSNREEEEEEK